MINRPRPWVPALAVGGCVLAAAWAIRFLRPAADRSATDDARPRGWVSLRHPEKSLPDSRSRGHDPLARPDRPAMDPESAADSPSPRPGSTEVATPPARRINDPETTASSSGSRRPGSIPGQSEQWGNAASAGTGKPDLPPAAAVEPLDSSTSIAVPLAWDDAQRPATIPAALAEIAPDTGASEPERAEAARTADEFLRRLEGTAEDPRDPERQELWWQAQEASDARMRASLGGHAWMWRHVEAHRTALPHPAPAPETPSGH